MIAQVLGPVVDRSRREMDAELARHVPPFTFVTRNHGAVTSNRGQA